MSDKLTMVVDLKAQIGQFNASMEQAKKKLVDAFSGKGIKNYSEELNKIGRIFDKLSLTTANPIDSKTTFGQMQKELTEADQRLNRLLDDLENLKRMSFTQRLSFLPDNFEQDLKKGKIALDGFYKTINAINNSKLNTEEYGQIQKTITEYNKKLDDTKKLEEEISNIQLTKKSSEDTRKQVSEQLELNKQYREQLEAFKQRNELEKAYKELTKDNTFTEEEIKQAAANGSSSIKQIVSKYPKNIADQIEAAANASKGSVFSEASKKRTKSRQSKAVEIPVVSDITQKEAKEKLEAIAKAYNELIVAQERFKQSGGIEEDLKNDTTAIEDLNAAINKESEDIKALDDVSKTADINITKKQQSLNALNATLNTNAKNFEEATKRQKELDAEFASTQKTKIAEAYTKLDEALKNCGLSLEQFGNIEEMDARQAQGLLQSLYDTNVVTPELDAAIQKITGAFNTMGEAANVTAQAVDRNSESFDKLTERAQNIDQLTNRIKYFTGFAGVINLARKSLRDAVQTITELDKAMTEMAVVTKATVSDYWEQLPKYTERANKLGATIRDMYEADTLYYQQGLKTNQVMQVANETMKMARIAGLGAAEATDRMTNALRGFNMEINEESAERINDVYSKLAAITASNVDEISTAMTKTASIAHSAGMEFETTAAFLSQIIETTRESAETAGTALKTVIARFQELKKKPSEIGEVEGEVVDANKIEGALRTVGIALRDSEGQFRKLDDVFIELAGKWGDLDKNTQRYIATIAAGSRQQSRFVALMQDYSHTVELVDAAYNSAGTSQKQYEKTLDSLQTKFNAFKNAWDTFTMSLFDNHIVKTAVDAGKTILNILNQVLDKFDVLDLGVPKIALVIAGVNKLGVAVRIFSGELKQSGNILKSFEAVGNSAMRSLKDAYGGVQIATASLEQYNKAQKALVNTEKERAKATEEANIAQKEANVLREEANRKGANLLKGGKNQKGGLTTSYNKAVKKANEAQTIADQKREIANNIELAKTQEEVVAAREALAKSTNLDAASTERLNGLLVAENSLELDNQRLIYLSAAATDEQTAADLQKALATKEITSTEQIRQFLEERGIKVKYQSIQANTLQALSESKLLAVLTLGTSKTILDTIAKKANAAAATSAAKANLLLAAGLVSVAAIAATVVATIYIIVKTIQSLLKLRLSERLKTAQDHLEDTSEAIKDCKDALADLEDEQDKYKSLHEELQKNIQGTKEWKDKLFEVNEQVYELIQKYPTLIGYVERLSSGELTISDAGWETITKEAQDKVINARVANYSAQREVYALEQEQRFDEIQGKLINEVISSGTGFVDQASRSLNLPSAEEIRKIIDSNTLEDALKELNIDINSLSPELLRGLEQYKTSVDKNTSALDVLSGSLVNGEFENGIEQAGAELITKGYLKTETETAGGSDWFRYGDTSKNRAANIRESGLFGSDFRDNKYFKEIAKYYKVSGFSGNDTADLAKLYASVMGVELTDEIKKRAKFGNDRTGMINEMLKAYDTAIAKDRAENTVKNTSSSTLELLGRASQVSSLRMGDIKELQALYTSDNTPEEIRKQLEEQLKAAGVNNFSQLYGKTFIKIMGENNLTSADLSEMANILTLDQLDDFARLRSREAGRGKGTTDFSRILSESEGAEILSELFSFDTSSLEDLELARKTLTDKWPQLTNEIEDLINQIAEFGGAVNKVDIQTLINKTKALSSELSKLNSYDRGISFTEEEKGKYIDNGLAKEEDFLFDDVSGNYVYLKPLDNLKQAILANTKALNQGRIDLDNQFSLTEQYRRKENDIKNNPYYNIDDFFRENQSLLGSLGVAGVTSNSNYDSLSQDLKDKLYDKLLEFVDTLTEDTYNADKKKITDTLASSYAASGTAATNLSKLFSLNSLNKIDKEAVEKAGILNLQEGEEGYDALIQQLEELRKGGEETEEQYKEFLKTLSNKKDITTAQKGMKNLMSTTQTFVEEYTKAGNNTELKMAEVLDQAEKFHLKGQNITEENYDMYAQLFDQFSNGNYEAYQMITKMLVGEQDVVISNVEDLWTSGIAITSDAMRELATMMTEYGLGYTEIIGGTAFLKGWKDTSAFASTSGKGNANPWEDPYNWLWNINKRINKEVFERERLERKYEKAVEDTVKTEQDLYDISKKELENLERQAQLERDKGTKAMQEAQMMMKQRADFAKYVSWDTTNGQIQVDYSSIDKLGWNSDRGSAFEDFVGRLEELIEEVQDSQTTLEEIEDLTEDIKNRGRDQYLELQDRIKNALVEINQREIDTREKINESIKTAQDELLNKIQEEISETRQIRSNQEKEQELEDKRQRLNYLRRDTTGANAVQIKKLEEELQKGEQSYTDSLTDQTLQNIQKANQKAEEQRAEEIEIMNNQLTRWQETGAIWETVDASINEGFDNPENFLNSQVGALLATAENKRALSELQQADWDKELENQAKLAELFNNGQLYQQGEQTLESVKACQNDLYTTMEETKQIGKVDQSLYNHLTEVYPKSYADRVSSSVSGIKSNTDLLRKYFEEYLAKYNTTQSYLAALKSSISTIKELNKDNPTTAQKKLENAMEERYRTVSGEKFATGGLNTKTGPAWLDGTPSKPEYVLNADQTKAFFDLVNTITSNEGKAGGTSGDNYFDIDINVDELSNDYDVENVAEKIKQMIWEDSQYRNVNLVSLLR